MSAFGTAYIMHLRANVKDLLDALRDIPANDFNTWKPAAAREGGHEMNTFAAIAIHVVSAGEFMTLHAVGNEPTDRNREAEFEATGDFAAIEARYIRWLDGVEALVPDLTDADLGREPYEEKYTERGWKVAEVLLHALDHTALHVGHVQVQRQLWQVERGA
jgi:hypothetical protein